MWWLGMKKKKQREQDKNFLVNGSMLQEQMIGFSNGKSNRIRNFTSLELQEATTAPYTCRGMYSISKGYFQNIPILVKKDFKDSRLAINDSVFASQMSVHKNVLKLLGVCLENKIPITVYEWAEHQSLQEYLMMRRPLIRRTDTHQQQQPPPPPLPWKLRLKIAAEVANVVVYLHTAFSRPIIHRDIKASHVLLDQQNVAKLCDFSHCIPIPEGEVRVKLDSASVAGTVGYMAPENLSTYSCSEKADVFSFGVLLMVLLTARNPFDIEWCDESDDEKIMLPDSVKRSVNGLADIMDPRILAEPFARCLGMNQQLERFAELALSCAAHREEDRPEMIDVEKQLRQMEHEALLFSRPRGCHDE